MGWMDDLRAQALAEDAAARCPVCGGYLGDYGTCVTVGCSGAWPVCGAPGGAGVSCQHPAGHDGPHGDRHEAWPQEQAPAVCCSCGQLAAVCCDSGFTDNPDGTRTHDDPLCNACCPCPGARRRRAQGECGRCGTPGHRTSDCPQTHD